MQDASSLGPVGISAKKKAGKVPEKCAIETEKRANGIRGLGKYGVGSRKQ